MNDQAKCELCGEPMPPGEQMFKFHGFSGPCPKEPLPKVNQSDIASELATWLATERTDAEKKLLLRNIAADLGLSECIVTDDGTDLESPMYVPKGYHIVEDADGIRLVKDS